MSNTLIAFNNRIDGATLSGGSWSGTLPLTNIQSRQLAKVARSSNLLLASTLINADITADKLVRVIGIVNHNFSLTAKFRIRAGSDNTFSTGVLLDTGWINIWPSVYASTSLEWQSTNWWAGRYSDEERAGITPERFYVNTSSINARYWRLEFDDASNTDGYVQIGRLFLGAGWQTKVNPQYGGLSLGLESPTEIQTALSGAEYFDKRTSFRVARFSTEWMSESEGMENAFEIQRQMGIDGEVVYIHDPDDTSQALRRQFLGRLRQLSPIEYPYVSLTKTAWEIRELL
ncbi:MAG: hypothetical protein WCO83_02225 [Alphaproteobacteria bacterium]